jgi:ABC-type polysaccharide/polyol phosphate export permease
VSQLSEAVASVAATPADRPRPTAPLQIRRSSGEHRTFVGELAHAVREVLGSRELLVQLVLRDIRVRYKQAIMGFAWAVLMPLVIVLAGTMIRIAMATVSGRALVPAVIGATAVKGLTWAFFSGALGTTTQSLLTNKALVTKLYFPREVLPLSSVLAQCVDTLIGATALLIALPFLGLTLTPQLLWVPVLAVLLLLLTTAVGLFTSCANLFFRDVKYIVQVVLTFGIFLTPVFFEPVMLGPLGGRLLMLNPVSPLIEGMRLAVIDGHNLLEPLVVYNRKGVGVLSWTPWYLVYSGVLALGGLVAGMRVFRRSAVVFAEYA